MSDHSQFRGWHVARDGRPHLSEQPLRRHDVRAVGKVRGKEHAWLFGPTLAARTLRPNPYRMRDVHGRAGAESHQTVTVVGRRGHYLVGGPSHPRFDLPQQSGLSARPQGARAGAGACQRGLQHPLNVVGVVDHPRPSGVT